MFYFPSLFRGNSFNAPATTDNKERNQSEEKTSPDIDYPEPLDPASLKKIAHMEDSKKLNLLKFKWKPEENFKFPSRNSRRYNPRWECDFPWLRYSKSEDSVYCGYCLVFAKSGCFSTSGYIDWKNAVGATYVHCRSHQLNLVLVNSCQKVPAVRNLMDSVGRMTWFVTASAKRKAILKRCLSGDKEGLINQLVSEGEKVNNELLQQGLRRDSIPSLCSTRWPSRVDCLSALMVKYPAFYETLSEIENESTGDARIEAAGHRRLLEDSSFIVSLVSSQYLLGFTRNLTDSLQESNCDLVKAFSDARNTRTVIISKRTNEDFEKIFEHARIVAQSVDCSLEIPRQVARQQHRANAPATTPCEYWRINLFFPFIDHLMTQFDERFPESSRNMYLGYYLIPKYLPQLDDEKLKAIRESYQADLPQFHSFEGFNERVLKRWDATGHRKIGKLWNKEQENSE